MVIPIRCYHADVSAASCHTSLLVLLINESIPSFSKIYMKVTDKSELAETRYSDPEKRNSSAIFSFVSETLLSRVICVRIGSNYFCFYNISTDNPLYTDTRNNDKIHYNDNLTITNPSVKR